MDNRRVTGDLIQKKALEIHNQHHQCSKNRCFLASDTWLQNFSARHNISYRQINIEQSSQETNYISPNSSEYTEIQKTIVNEYDQYHKNNHKKTANKYHEVNCETASTTDMLKDLVDSAVFAIVDHNIQ